MGSDPWSKNLDTMGYSQGDGKREGNKEVDVDASMVTKGPFAFNVVDIEVEGRVGLDDLHRKENVKNDRYVDVRENRGVGCALPSACRRDGKGW